MKNEVLLKPEKYFEISLLQSRKNKQFCLICLSLAMNMSNTILLQNFDRPIGSRAINKTLEGRISKKQAFGFHQRGKQSHLKQSVEGVTIHLRKYSK